jgi:hypothetical protein
VEEALVEEEALVVVGVVYVKGLIIKFLFTSYKVRTLLKQKHIENTLRDYLSQDTDGNHIPLIINA